MIKQFDPERARETVHRLRQGKPGVPLITLTEKREGEVVISTIRPIDLPLHRRANALLGNGMRVEKGAGK